MENLMAKAYQEPVLDDELHAFSLSCTFGLVGTNRHYGSVVVSCRVGLSQLVVIGVNGGFVTIGLAHRTLEIVSYQQMGDFVQKFKGIGMSYQPALWLRMLPRR